MEDLGKLMTNSLSSKELLEELLSIYRDFTEAYITVDFLDGREDDMKSRMTFHVYVLNLMIDMLSAEIKDKRNGK